jgi:hypothetical protein
MTILYDPGHNIIHAIIAYYIIRIRLSLVSLSLSFRRRGFEFNFDGRDQRLHNNSYYIIVYNKI